MLAEIQHVTKRYRRGSEQIAALQDVSLALASGDFVAITGPSGCGKSTLLLTLGGLLRPTAGSVWVDGKSVYELSSNDRAALRARCVGFVFQQFHLVPYLSVEENIQAATLGHPAPTSAAAAERARELMDQFALAQRRRHRPDQLSVGERQRVALARAVFHRPQLILADEPTGNLDRENADRVLDCLDQFRTAGGAVMLVTHDPHAAARAQQHARMENGRLVAN